MYLSSRAGGCRLILDRDIRCNQTRTNQKVTATELAVVFKCMGESVSVLFDGTSVCLFCMVQVVSVCDSRFKIVIESTIRSAESLQFRVQQSQVVTLFG